MATRRTRLSESEKLRLGVRDVPTHIWRSAAVWAYAGWFLLVLGVLIAMLVAAVSLAGVVASFGCAILMWAAPMLLWPERFD